MQQLKSALQLLHLQLVRPSLNPGALQKSNTALRPILPIDPETGHEGANCKKYIRGCLIIWFVSTTSLDAS